MQATEIGGVIVGALVALGIVGLGAAKLITLVRNGNGNGKHVPVCPVNAGDGLRLVNDTLREQVTLLRDIRDGSMSLRADLRVQSLEQAHLTKSVEALHTRFDAAIGSRKP